MRRIEGLLLAACGLAAGTAPAAEPALRYRAPIELTQAAPLIELALPASVYARAVQPQLQDLRIVDAAGQRVPFARLTPRIDRTPRITAQTPAPIYPLAPRPRADAEWASPVEVLVQGDRVSVKRRPGAATSDALAPGWLIDLDDPVGLDERRESKAERPQQLRLAWSGPDSFSASFSLETSADLRRWRPAGIGQLMALVSPQGALVQDLALLPADVERFVRLVWFDPAAAPALSGALAERVQDRRVLDEEEAELRFAASAEPPGKAGADEASAGALHFDLGGRLPISQLELLLGEGTRVAPVRVQGRDVVDAPWRDLGRAVFYRLEHEGQLSRSPPLRLQAAARYLRIVPDARSAALDPATTGLRVHATVARLVFANQGQPPFSLRAGAADADDGALLLATLVPGGGEERPAFGRATLGEWQEDEAVARERESERRRAAWRPWLLWGLLVAGVAALGAMVWRLARGSAAPP